MNTKDNEPAPMRATIAQHIERTVEPEALLDETVGATSPINWWRITVIGLAALVFGLLVLQFLTGGGATPTS